MARQIEEFTTAWQSLSGVIEQNGWQSISVFSHGPCEIKAARHFPGNEESILISFPNTNLPRSEKLPEGVGFIVDRVDFGENGRIWIALSRKESGNIELFANMVCDVVTVLDNNSSAEASKLLRMFLSRLHSWQEFMRRGIQVLGPEEEIGLIGELFFLNSFIRMGAPQLSIVESWVGPLKGIQDFVIGTGAVEVKASISTTGFIARIASLEQLDDSIRQPLFLAAVKFTQTESGVNLPGFVELVESSLEEDEVAKSIFSEKLLAAGYLDLHAERYTRRFIMQSSRIIEVKDDFPRLTHGRVHTNIKRAVYDLDIEKVVGENLGISEILIRLGAL